MALLAAAPALAAEAAQPAASRLCPRWRIIWAFTTHSRTIASEWKSTTRKALESAFWEDGADIAVPNPGQEIRMPLKGGFPPQAPAGQPGPNAGPPPGLQPPPGSNAGPAGPGGGGEGEVWHLPLDSYIHFESATRATHYEYFLSIYPQPEKKGEGGNAGNMQNARTSIVGWPGHYEDILEKRHGEWRILQRKSMINQK